jgi:hypothetical protein
MSQVIGLITDGVAVNNSTFVIALTLVASKQKSETPSVNQEYPRPLGLNLPFVQNRFSYRTVVFTIRQYCNRLAA